MLDIFNNFIKIADPVSGMPDVMQPLARDIIQDVRDLIPEVEEVLAKKNITPEIQKMMAEVLNMTFIMNEIIPGKIMNTNVDY